MNQNSKLPTTIVTGFLGSGKTTLLRHLLTHADGRRLAVIVNDASGIGTKDAAVIGKQRGLVTGFFAATGD